MQNHLVNQALWCLVKTDEEVGDSVGDLVTLAHNVSFEGAFGPKTKGGDYVNFSILSTQKAVN